MIPNQDLAVVNCIDYTDEYTLFSDYFSSVALSAGPSDVAGLHRLYFKGLNSGSILPTFEPVARPFLRAPGGPWEHVAALGFESRPEGWTQTGATSRYFVTQRVQFLNEALLRVSFELQRRTDAEVAPEFGILGAIYPEQAELIRGTIREQVACLAFRKKFFNIFLKREASFFVRTTWQFCRDLSAQSGLRADQALPTLPPESHGWMPNLALSDNACWWLQTEPDCADGGWSVVLTISLSFDDCDEAGCESRHGHLSEPPHFDFGLLPAAEPNTLYWNRKLHQAMTTMIAAGVRHAGYGSFSSDLGLLASLPNWSSTVWFWDHFISAAAVGAFRPEWMTSAVRCILRHTSNQRIGPGILLAFPPYGSEDHMVDCYAPIASWAVTKAWHAHGRRPDLPAIYPLLAEHHEGWYRHCDRDGDGIPEWRNSGNPADDSPRFDPYAPAPGAACFELPPFPSADLCAYLLLDARCLKRFAQMLGLAFEAEHWEGRAEALRRHLLARHWDEEELFFHDRMPDGSFYKIKTFFGLLPL